MFIARLKENNTQYRQLFTNKNFKNEQEGHIHKGVNKQVQHKNALAHKAYKCR